MGTENSRWGKMKDVKKCILLFRTKKGIKRSKPPKLLSEQEQSTRNGEQEVSGSENDRVDTVKGGVNE